MNQPKNLSSLMIKSLIIAVTALSLAYLMGFSAAADTKQQKSITYNGVTVTPAIIRVVIAEGQQQANFNISVTNNTSQSVDLGISSSDFKSLNESGGLAFIANNSTLLSSKHGLANWLVPSTNTIHLDPKQSQNLMVTVENREDLAPGGHYAAILFQGTAGDTNKGATHVAINQVVSSLVFVQKLGGEKYGLSLAPPRIPTSWFHLPSSINLFFKNTGNTQEVPYGLATITDPFGREVLRGQINTDSGLVLPDSTRIYRTPLFATGRSWLGGRYTVKIVYHSDGVKNTQVMTSSFLYFNFKFLGLVFLIILVIGIVVRKSPNLPLLRKHKRK